MSSNIPASPLRYPGGKTALAPLLASIMERNDLHDGVFAEPFAGGAGAALRLLFGEYASTVAINDLDRRIYAFWRAAINQTEQLSELVESTPVTMDTWRDCREVYQHPSRHNQLRVAFATFFLNRCNRSGILYGGGPIGGHDQTGKWKLDARWDPPSLVQRLRRIYEYRDRISVTGVDVLTFLRKHLPSEPDARRLVFLDPPYYEKGQRLYLNNMSHQDHEELANFLHTEPPFYWVLTYDNVDEIQAMYADLQPRPFTLRYTASQRRRGKELLVIDPRLDFPTSELPMFHRPGKLRFAPVATPS